jgi:hypothetical protein
LAAHFIPTQADAFAFAEIFRNSLERFYFGLVNLLGRFNFDEERSFPGPFNYKINFRILVRSKIGKTKIVL